MDREEIKQAILAGKSKGVQYISIHQALISELLQDGESIGAVYEALKKSSSPPPISRSQFYRHVKNKIINQEHANLNSHLNDESKLIDNFNSKHNSINQTSKKQSPIHDSGIDADKLI